MAVKDYAIRVLIAFDQLVQACLRSGLPGQTISARAGKAARRSRAWGCVLCRFLDWLDPDHCEGAIAGDIARAKAVIADLEDS